MFYTAALRLGTGGAGGGSIRDPGPRATLFIALTSEPSVDSDRSARCCSAWRVSSGWVLLPSSGLQAQATQRRAK